MDSVEILLWMERREYDALAAALRKKGKDDLDAAMKEMLQDYYEKTVPEAVRRDVAQEILAEELAREQAQEANRRRSSIMFRHYERTSFYESDKEFDDLTMAGLIRRHVRDELVGPLDEHLHIRGDGPISREAMLDLIEMRERNSALVTGVFLIDLDKGVYGTLQVTEGWRLYPLRAVSAAIYRVQRSPSRNPFRRLTLYWDQLKGRALSKEEYTVEI